MTLATERLPFRIICQRCGHWDKESLTVVEVAAFNRNLRLGPSKPTDGVDNRCHRNTEVGKQGRCNGLLQVEP